MNYYCLFGSLHYYNTSEIFLCNKCLCIKKIDSIFHSQCIVLYEYMLCITHCNKIRNIFQQNFFNIQVRFFIRFE